MDPHTLIDTTIVPGLPAPFWLIQALKVFGFILHEFPMNLWFAGILWSMILAAIGSEHGKRFSSRLMSQMPVILAMGINFGIVPLLFIQVAYSKVFYPATILMAWFWLAIVILLIPAYYGIYIYAFGLYDNERTMRRWKRAVGWTSAMLFVTIGFLFVNGLSLTANVGQWPGIFERTHVAGAPTGLGLNLSDPQIWPRWLMMFGLAQMTTAVWLVFDAAWFGRRESETYKRWALDSAWKLYTFGLLWYGGMAAWYMLGTWPEEIQRPMFFSPWVILTLAAGLSTLPVWWLLMQVRRRAAVDDRRWPTAAALAQLGVLTFNAIARQVVQNLEVSRYFDVAKQPIETQWGSLILFLITFVAGVLVVVWMIAQVAKAETVEAA
jgi:hypothetical protein